MSSLIYPSKTNCVGLGLLCLFIATSALVVGCTSSNPPKPSEATSKSIERTIEKGPVKLTIRITPESPRLSDTVAMEVEVTADDRVEIQAPKFGQAVGEFLIRDYSEKTPTSDAKSAEGSKKPKNYRAFHYQLEPVHAGRHLIRSVAIEFLDNRPDSENAGKLAMIESEPIEIDVTSELGNEIPDLNRLEPDVPPRPVDSPYSWIWLLALLPIALVALLYSWIRFKRKSIELPPVVQSPQEIAQQALAALLQEELLKQGRFQEFYLRLTGIVRVYIEGTTGVRAPEQTTEEFLRAMRSRDLFTATQSLRLQEFLEAADMVKYAAQLPSMDQVDVSIDRAREFITMEPPQSAVFRSEMVEPSSSHEERN